MVISISENLFVLTAGGKEAYKHYIDTIEEGFTADSVKDFLTNEEYQKIKYLFGERKIRAWGATSGARNKRNWEKLNTNDKIIIYRERNFEYIVRVVFKFHNAALAKHLWKTNAAGETWEYIYLLDDPIEISVPAEDFNNAVGYSKYFIPQGFSTFGEQALETIKSKYRSIDQFLKYLANGEWIKNKKEIPETIKKEILEQKIRRYSERPDLLEANLENFIVNQLNNIEDGLELIGRQKVTDVGRIDLLCKDMQGNCVVIELKRMKATSSIMDQILRYMGWIEIHQEECKAVRGIIIVGKKDTYLEYAAKAVPNLQIKVFNISFK